MTTLCPPTTLDGRPSDMPAADPTRTSPVQRLATALANPTPLTRMLWVALAGVPVLWVVEYTGPRALNLVLRGSWVLLVAAIAAMWAAGALRRPRRRGGQDFSR